MSGEQRRLISSGGPWEEHVGYSRAVVVGDRVWVAGTTGTQPDGSVAETAEAQARIALDLIAAALAEAGAAMTDVVVARCYVVDVAEWESIVPAIRERFGAVRPAMTMVQVAALIAPRHRVEIEVEAIVGSGARPGAG